MKKRGLSAIVTTLIIILLVLVAVGGIWAVVSNFIDEGTETFSLSQKCLAVNLDINSAACDDDGNNWECDVTYERKVGGEDIDGIRIVLSNGAKSFTKDVSGNLEEFGINTENGINTEMVKTEDEPNSVQLAVYFNDPSGTPQLCSPTSSFTF